jgi:glycosyltransferase involved in cell wall biosynthesis/2-polyprenyl-3-methyl-5-hydroxy-6-metoxy-1,4-benzoquinol methylase
LKILFLIRSLHCGGQERQLVLLSKGLSDRGHDVVIAIFYSGGPFEKDLWNTKVRIRALNKRGRWDLLGFGVRLIKVLREERPDIIHGYLFDPNLMTVMLKPLFPTAKIIWGIRCSNLNFGNYDWLTQLSCKVNAWLSRFPDAIIANSRVGREYHLSVGYPAEKMVVIPNGIDTERFRPDSEARRLIRSDWSVAEHETLIGLVGRLDPMKDHSIFLEAAALLASKRKHTRFVCVGGGPDEYRATLQTLAKSLGLEERLLWAGTREDMPTVYNALDIVVSSSSYGEGFSNVIGEAMACGVPCVVTNVGDSAWLVGDAGEVVPPKDPVALMNAIDKSLDRPLCSPAQIRQRVVEGLSTETLIINTERELLKLTAGPHLSANHLEAGMRSAAMRSDDNRKNMKKKQSQIERDQTRFEFGKNWSRFLESVDDVRIREAEQSLKDMLGVKTLQDKSFLDIGSGSGLFSLAARGLGARVHSFDYDPQSVACAAELKRRYFPNDGKWTITEGSVLDEEHMLSLGRFDVVYSWGVLHHTGAMRQAMENVCLAVASGGQLYIAIYNDQGWRTIYWTTIKRLYHAVPRVGRSALVGMVFLSWWTPKILRDSLTGRPLRTWKNYIKQRGMSPWWDAVDWVGGYPFEVAKPEEIFHFYRDRGFTMTNLKTCGGKLGNNHFVFEKGTGRTANGS